MSAKHDPFSIGKGIISKWADLVLALERYVFRVDSIILDPAGECCNINQYTHTFLMLYCMQSFAYSNMEENKLKIILKVLRF